MSQNPTTIPGWDELREDPATDRVNQLTETLTPLDGPADEAGSWPSDLWDTLAVAGVTGWSLPAELGGEACDRGLLLQRYARVAEGSLTAAFILSQHDAAVRRLLAGRDRLRAQDWLRKIASGDAFATIGISHLTTSKRLGDRPMSAVIEKGGYRLDGALPWVTAAERADVLVTGAPLDDGRQILVALPTNRTGLKVAPAFELAALQASRTTEVFCDSVRVEDEDLLVDPTENVMAHASAAGTGGLETSALALGQARAALVALAAQAPSRAGLDAPVQALAGQWLEAWDVLMAASEGAPGAPNAGQARGLANGLVVRATQAYLTARKGSGFLRTEPAQRWARQALFFLVWSCPGPVAEATIRDLAGLCHD